MSLTGTETFGEVVPGFVTDGDGNLSLAATGTQWVDGFWRDDDGRLAYVGTADGTVLGTVVPGFLTDANGALVLVTASPVDRGSVVPGFVTDADGALLIEDAPASPAWDDGFLRNSTGYLAAAVPP
jgi:hypothetical protein